MVYFGLSRYAMERKGIAQFIDLIPTANNNLLIWNFPTMDAPDVRFILHLLTGRLRQHRLALLQKSGTDVKDANA